MKGNNKNILKEDEERTFHQEVLDLFKEIAQNLLNWLKPNLTEPVYLIILKTILKIPVLLLMILISPIALVILAFTFIVLL